VADFLKERFLHPPLLAPGWQRGEPARCKRSPALSVKQMADEHMRGRIVEFLAVTSVMIEAAAAVANALWGYLFGAVFIIAMAVSLLGCSDSRLSPGLLLGNGSGSQAGSAGAASFGELPGNSPGYIVGIQIRN
jgi:hypothetical protein